mmetsp:Transcript_40015/g.43392  ORF Transcript_40015/g.43392 Transcript_40015/m.43392 type:complete len:130 (-) Transcript_40015:199-588(-)
MLLHHSLKKVFALVSTTTASSKGSLSNWVSTTTASITTSSSSSSSSSALYSTSSSSSSSSSSESDGTGTSILGKLAPSAKNLLFDVPVSNNGGRARIILYVTLRYVAYIEYITYIVRFGSSFNSEEETN